MSYLADPASWPKLAAILRAAGEFGLDTETYNQAPKTSPQHRTKIQCWSIGVLGSERHPRGYRRAVGRVLPRAALDCPELQAVLADPAVVKWAHNSPHDHHSLVNEGVTVANMVDSLQYARVAVPGQSTYGLKDMEVWALGYPTRPSFRETVAYVGEVRRVKRTVESGCVCGKKPCRARSTSDFVDDLGNWRSHTRVTWRRFTSTSHPCAASYPVESIQPGHPIWDTWVEYSLLDAVRGMELVDWIRNRKPHRIEYPWKLQLG